MFLILLLSNESSKLFVDNINKLISVKNPKYIVDMIMSIEAKIDVNDICIKTEKNNSL